MPTIGEAVFASYLKTHGYTFEFEKETPGKKKRPDYRIERSTSRALCEMKDLEPDWPPADQVVSIDPYPRIREKINQASRKFREYKGEVCCLVLYNEGNFFVDLDTPIIMLGAMYGDAGISFPIKMGTSGAAGPTKQTFLKRGKMIQPGFTKPQNTTISALVTLREVHVGSLKLRAYLREHPGIQTEDILGLTSEKVGFDLGEKQVGVIVWENAFAALPLPRDLFNGPYDIRWGVGVDGQSIVHQGKGLPNLERSGSA